MMRTFTAPMHTDTGGTGHGDGGFTFVELMVTLVMVSLFVALGVPNLMGLVNRMTFKAKLQDFVSAMQMAASSAAQSDRRYEIIIDIPRQNYILRQISSDNLSDVRQEEVIIDNDFGRDCWVLHVIFDDGEFTNDARAKFRIGRTGWAYGGKIVFVNDSGSRYTVLVNRLGRTIELQEGDAEILLPRFPDDVVF